MKVSVITVAYNAIETIEKTLVSVQAQEGVIIEHILIDGGSTDGTVDIIEKFLRDDDVFISEADDGIYSAMNKGLKLASGDIIAILNSDDVFYSTKTVSSVLTEFSSNSVDIIYSDIVYIDCSGNITGKWLPGSYDNNEFAMGWHPPHPGFFCKRSCYDIAGNFDESLAIAADFDLMLRFLEVFSFKSKYLNLYTVSMYHGGTSAQLMSIFRGFRDIRMSFMKYGIDIGFFYFFNRYGNKILRKLRISFP